MALFLFLVCAALAAVILAASTAAAGRVAGLAEADQKYYSVSSAAELMRDMMGGNNGVSVQVECTKTTKFTRSAGGVMTQQGDPTYTFEIKYGSGTGAFFGELAKQLVLAEAGSDADDVWNWQLGTSSSGDSSGDFGLAYTYNITGGNAAKAQAVLEQVDIDASLKPNGDIVLTFSAGKGQAATPSKSAYVMELTCEAQGETKAATKTQTSGTTVTRIETKTTTLTWKASKLKSPTSLGA